MSLDDSLTLDALERDPDPILARLRDGAPVAYSSSMNLWLVTRWDDVESMERRPEKRTRKRIACEIVEAAGTRSSGIVLDVSPRGLFVHTNAHPVPGTQVDVLLKLPGMDEPVTMRTKVARLVLVPPQLTAVAHGGIGLRIPGRASGANAC